MTTFYVEVPAHVQHENRISNSVVVKGGSNWDLSRSAVETPIAAITSPAPIQAEPKLPSGLSRYSPVHMMPLSSPAVTVEFKANSVLVPAVGQRELKQISKGTTVIVAGHAGSTEKNADALSKKRADVVAAQLRKQGKKVAISQGFGSSVPLDSTDPSVTMRRVEVFTPQ